MHSSLNDTAQTTSDDMQNSSDDVDNLNRIDEALAKFFFGCNIPFTVVESIHFKNFVSILNPTYKLPTRKTLSTSILDKLHTKMIANRKESLKSTESVLLIDGWKNASANTKNVVCVLHNASKKQQVFLESYDFSGLKETATALEKVVNEATELAMDLYGTTIYAIVSDNVSSMIAMGKSIDLWHTTCNSHSANLLAKSLVEKNFATKVNALLKEFKNPNLEVELIKRGGSKIVLACETRWCSYRDSFKCALKNLDIMRTVVQEKQIKFNHESDALLQSSEFEIILQDYILIFDPVCELVNKCQRSSSNIADAIEYWLTLNIPTCNDNQDKLIKARIQKATKPICFAANFLHPVYQGQRLSYDQREWAIHFIKKHLNEMGLKELETFQAETGFFKKLFTKNIKDPYIFWSTSKNHAPHLSKLALKLFDIPSSTAELERLFSYWGYVHSVIRNRLTAKRSKALVDIYYTLRFEDNCDFNAFII